MNRRMWRIVPPLIAGLMLLGFVVTGGVAADVPYTRLRALRVEIMALVDGIMDVDGAVTLNSTLDVDGLVTANGGMVVTGANSATGAVAGSTGAFTTTLKSGGQANFNGGSVTVGQASATGAVVGASATITGTAAANALEATTSATVGTWGIFTKQSNITVTAGGNISPTGTYQPLTAAGAVGTSDITAGAAGRLLILTNVGTNAITITDTGTIMLGADCALGQYDTLTLLSDGTNWLELNRNDN